MAQDSSPLTAKIYPRRKPSSVSEDAAIAPQEDFPSSNHLVVSTTKGVYTWTHEGVDELFRSESGGIAAAKRIFDGGNLLAIADSHIIILHNIETGVPERHGLKGITVCTMMGRGSCDLFRSSFSYSAGLSTSFFLVLRLF